MCREYRNRAVEAGRRQQAVVKSATVLRAKRVGSTS